MPAAQSAWMYCSATASGSGTLSLSHGISPVSARAIATYSTVQMMSDAKPGGVQGGPQIGYQPPRHGDAEAAEQGIEVSRPIDGERDVTDGVLEDQVPADDPRDELAEGGIRIGVRTARNRDERRELGVGQRRKRACRPRQDDRDDDGRARAHMAGVARDRRAERGEDTGAGDGTDAQRPELARD